MCSKAKDSLLYAAARAAALFLHVSSVLDPRSDTFKLNGLL